MKPLGGGGGNVPMGGPPQRKEGGSVGPLYFVDFEMNHIAGQYQEERTFSKWKL